MADVIIAGGGIAGLSVAYELTKAGIPYLLLEAGSRPGGVVLSEPVDGFTIDAGPDSLLVQKPDGIRLAEEVGLGARLVPTLPPRIAYIQRGGRLHALPASSVLGVPTEIGPFFRTTLFSWRGKLRMGAEVFVRRRESPDDESVGEFMTRRFGVEATRYLAEPLLAGIHAGDVNLLSLHALFPRFVDAERTHGSLIRAFRAERRGRPPGGMGEGAFRSLPGGLSELVQAIASRLSAEAVRLQTEVTQLATDDAGDYLVHTSDGRRVTARAVVLTTPAYVTARVVRPLDEGLARLCESVSYASTATIAVAFEREQVRHPLQGSGFVVPEAEGTGILAASWLSSKWPHRAPAGRVLMRVFAGGTRDPGAVDRSDEDLLKLALRAIAPLLGISGAPMFHRIYRWVNASAQHNVGHLSLVEGIERMLARHPGLFITGSGFRGVGIPDCVADGRRTAREAAAWVRSRVRGRREGLG
jgi:oxygen-dependent protoporphyrinogen oxidase